MPPITERSMRRWLPVLLGLLLSAGSLAACTSGASHPAAAPDPAASTPAGHHLVYRTAREPWRLNAPVSRLVAVPTAGGALLAGGLDSSNTSSNSVSQLTFGTGAERPVGTVPHAFHDGAAARLHGRLVIFGGGSLSSSSAVQAAGAGGRGRGRVIGQLPQPRSDLSAVTVGSQVYVLGGYTGSTELHSILATTDGTSFRTVGRLPVTVRYAAVAAVGSTIWVIGGEHGNHPVRDIQTFDTATGRSRIAGMLPAARTEATAVDLAGHLLVAGGRDASGAATAEIDELDAATAAVHPVGRLQAPTADAAVTTAGSTAYLIGGEAAHPLSIVQTIAARSVADPTPPPTPAAAPLSDQHPFNGQLLIADRGNNRLLSVDAAKQILWRFPTAARPAPPSGFYFPDDAFFIHHGTGIISNQEGNDTVVEVGFPSGTPLWSYGHPKVAKAAPGYLHEPDDAYLLRNGKVVVADANNCRVVIISPGGHQVGQIGTPGSCVHRPPHSLGYPNGDTPLPDGNLLISEVDGSWVSEYTLTGHLVWTVQLPSVGYPSDPQQIGPDRYLVADYSKPGGIVEFNRAGRILWRYAPNHGAGMLNHPSLSEVLPGGYICANDDYRQRVVIINQRTKQIVWQYGHTDHHGRRPGYLHIPDGFDLLEPDGSTPTHPDTG